MRAIEAEAETDESRRARENRRQRPARNKLTKEHKALGKALDVFASASQSIFAHPTPEQRDRAHEVQKHIADFVKYLPQQIQRIEANEQVQRGQGRGRDGRGGDSEILRRQQKPANAAPPNPASVRPKSFRIFNTHFKEVSGRAAHFRPRAASADHSREGQLPRQAHRPPSRSGPMSRGELYLYYERIGMLQVYFTLFPGG
jgi:hypothetical protein